MGQIAKAVEQKAIAHTQDAGFKGLLERSWPRIAAVMPKHMNADRMFQLALSCYNSTPGLAECSPASILGCLMQASALGLEPSAVDGLGRAYILPYKNRKTGTKEAQFILGYKGIIDLARRSGRIKDISARAVHEGDEFHYQYGLEEDLYHVPSTEPVEGRPLTHVYMVAHFTDGGHYIDVMSKAEVDAIKARSKAAKFGPWVTDYEAMAKKTVIRRAAPYLPLSTEVARGIQADSTTPVIDMDREGPDIIMPGVYEAEDVPQDVDPETGEVKEPETQPSAEVVA